MKPYLRKNIPQSFDEIPAVTAYEAGFLVAKNAGWRSVRPVVENDKCVICGQCYMYCPDGVISINENNIVIDYDFCKGCGICQKICRPGAIKMQEEK